MCRHCACDGSMCEHGIQRWNMPSLYFPFAFFHLSPRFRGRMWPSFHLSIFLLPILPSVSTSTWMALFAGSVQIEQTINVMGVGWTNMHFSVQWWRRRKSKLLGGIWNDRRGTTASRLSRWDSKDHMLHFVYRAVTISAKFGQWKRIYTLAQSLPTEYLNEKLTMPEATRSHSPLHSIWGIHAVFPTASLIFLKAGSILHSPTHPPSSCQVENTERAYKWAEENIASPELENSQLTNSQ